MRVDTDVALPVVSLPQIPVWRTKFEQDVVESFEPARAARGQKDNQAWSRIQRLFVLACGLLVAVLGVFSGGRRWMLRCEFTSKKKA